MNRLSGIYYTTESYFFPMLEENFYEITVGWCIFILRFAYTMVLLSFSPYDLSGSRRAAEKVKNEK